MIPDVSCERCHGPAREHVDVARRWEAGDRSVSDDALVLPFGLGRWQAEEQVRFCGYCHRLPEKFAAAEIRPENAKLVRFPSVGLLQSQCYGRSQGALSCTTPSAKAAIAACSLTAGLAANSGTRVTD